jgi:hypothetical protein
VFEFAGVLEFDSVFEFNSVGAAAAAASEAELTGSSATVHREAPAITALQQTIENKTLFMASTPSMGISRSPTSGRFQWQHDKRMT